LFLRGDYHPLAGGEHVIAFRRSFDEQRLLVFVTRWPLLRTRGAHPWVVGEAWGDERHRVPFSGTYEDVFTGVRRRVHSDVALREVFADLPVAVLLMKG
jgi:maltooligosyltrehalose synthase